MAKINSALLRSAGLKLRRVKSHFYRLQQAVKRFGDKHPYSLVEEIEGDRQTGDYILRFNVSEPLPDIFGLLIDDICNNLVSALDHAMWAMYLAQKPRFNEKIYFPYLRERSRYKRAMKGHIKVIDPTQVAGLDGLQQDQALARALDVLRAINNADKHRAVHILRATGTSRQVRFSFANPIVVGPRGAHEFRATIPPNVRVVDRAEGLRVPLSQFPNGKVQVDFGMRADFIFDTPREAGGAHIISTIGLATSCTEAVLDSLAPTF
jgi:hypothetical protein